MISALTRGLDDVAATFSPTFLDCASPPRNKSLPEISRSPASSREDLVGGPVTSVETVGVDPEEGIAVIIRFSTTGVGTYVAAEGAGMRSSFTRRFVGSYVVLGNESSSSNHDISSFDHDASSSFKHSSSVMALLADDTLEVVFLVPSPTPRPTVMTITAVVATIAAIHFFFELIPPRPPSDPLAAILMCLKLYSCVRLSESNRLMVEINL